MKSFFSIDRTKSDPDELFRINSATGTIYINKKLDSETETEHRLTVLATDGGAQVMQRPTRFLDEFTIYMFTTLRAL